MRAYEIIEGQSIDNLKIGERDMPTPGPGQVVVKVEAVSLNYRDLLTIQRPAGDPLVPCSCGAGTISAVGDGVQSLKEGDRVASVFFQTWVEGGPSAANRSQPLGGVLDGMLQEYALLSEMGVVPIPDSMTLAEASTLPCAGLTAWRALIEECHVKAGDTVLCEGTGGVSIFALQFAKMSGAEVIITSSADEKLERAKALGADHGINYTSEPEWGRAARGLTGGAGVDHIVEVGGSETLLNAIGAAKVGGNIILIGILSGFSKEIPIGSIFGNNLHMTGISVGSRAMMVDMIAAMSANGMQPVIDKRFSFDDAQEAFRTMQAGTHFGKICIEF